MGSFDLVLDCTQFTNVNGLGFSHKFLQSQDNYMMEVFIKHMDKGFETAQLTDHATARGRLLFEYRDMKCRCATTASRESADSKLPVGDLLIQYYYLSQRHLHSQADQSMAYPRDQKVGISERTKMSLADILKVKKLADNVSFLRLYFLKN